MKNIFKVAGILALALLVLSGCRTATIYNVKNTPVELNKKVSEDKMYKAIKVAGLGLGWRVSKIKPGLAKAQLNIRNHMAQVEIPYNSKEFSIIYKNSLNLKYDSTKKTIHSNYNGWIQNLENAINLQLSTLKN
ncbi:hypothetical protein [Malaciobacter marinus]|uniref:hypothetical protein n=1 Tax=Malaciobacter marinus TaxID=505249 RepID=UPI001010296D|nr:hypothetical protein [Malaciobacter halophilus]RYA23194.1 hypothetical protein CRU96_08945 [Malaciobacter halophilus]